MTASPLLPALLAHRYIVKTGFSVLALFVLLLVLLVFFLPHTTPVYQLRDFDAFWVTAQISQSATPAAVYDGLVQTQVFGRYFPAEAGKSAIGFLYPPTTLLLLAPFAQLPIGLAYLAFCIFSLLCISVLAVAINRHHGLLLVWGFPAVFLCLTFGQISVLLAALLGGAAVLLGPRPLLAGLLAGLCILKPQLGFLIGFAVLGTHSTRAFVMASLTIALLVTASLLLFGNLWPVALTSMMGNAAEPLSALHWLKHFASPYAVLMQFGVPYQLAFIVQLFCTLAAIAGTYWIFNRTKRAEYRLWAMGLLPLWATPFAYQYDTALQCLPLLALMKIGRTTGLSLTEIFVGGTLMLLGLMPMFSANTPVTLGLQLVASATLLACLARRISCEQPPEPQDAP